jgi:hypothetical protein
MTSETGTVSLYVSHMATITHSCVHSLRQGHLHVHRQCCSGTTSEDMLTVGDGNHEKGLSQGVRSSGAQEEGL